VRYNTEVREAFGMQVPLFSQTAEHTNFNQWISGIFAQYSGNTVLLACVEMEEKQRTINNSKYYQKSILWT
jgi:hypothetical protein